MCVCVYSCYTQVVQALYGSRSTLFQRESLGLIADDNSAVFTTASVARLFNGPRVTVSYDLLSSIFVAGAVCALSLIHI